MKTTTQQEAKAAQQEAKAVVLRELPWMREAKAMLGQREVKGPRHNSRIVQLWIDMKSHFRDDETPWCGAFIGGTLVKAGRPAYPAGASARAWLKYPGGRRIDRPAYGAVAVYSRKGGGHVGFVVGKDRQGRVMILGGNQGDVVSVKLGNAGNLLGYVWPTLGGPLPNRFDLPLVAATTVSTKES